MQQQELTEGQIKRRHKARLWRQGFDRCSSSAGSMYVRVGCSQCEALCVNGVACHETGCPRARSKKGR